MGTLFKGIVHNYLAFQKKETFKQLFTAAETFIWLFYSVLYENKFKKEKTLKIIINLSIYILNI